MRMWAIKYSDGRFGELVHQGRAVTAFNSIPAELRARCSLHCFEEVVDVDRDTEIPPRAEQRTLDESEGRS